MAVSTGGPEEHDAAATELQSAFEDLKKALYAYEKEVLTADETVSFLTEQLNIQYRYEYLLQRIRQWFEREHATP